MKIAITGTHCCGKSTVMRKVQEKILSHHQYDAEVDFFGFSGNNAPIDYSSSQKLKDNSQSELSLTLWMISALTKRECETAHTKPICVYDRCLLDQIVYPKTLMKEKYPDYIEAYIEGYLQAFPYQKVFILPANLELLERYGSKDKSFDYANEIHKSYLKLSQKYPYITVLSENQEQQVEDIYSYIIKQV